MAKKCIVCGENAELCIKDTSDFYCKECAEEHFSDISYLAKVEEDAQKLKRLIEQGDDLQSLDEDDDTDDDSDDPEDDDPEEDLKEE